MPQWWCRTISSKRLRAGTLVLPEVKVPAEIGAHRRLRRLSFLGLVTAFHFFINGLWRRVFPAKCWHAWPALLREFTERRRTKGFKFLHFSIFRFFILMH